jgi:hypothetical protein
MNTIHLSHNNQQYTCKFNTSFLYTKLVRTVIFPTKPNNWIILTKGRGDILLLPALLSSSERYIGAMEELELLLKRRNKKCLEKKIEKNDFLYILFQREKHILSLEY